MVRSISLAAVIAAALALPAAAQTAPGPNTPPAATTPTAPSVTTAPKSTGATMTSQEALTWVGKPVYSSDGKNLGKVVSLVRGTDNAVSELDADIGGFLGLGATHVKIMPAQFKLQVDRVNLTLTAEQAKNLPVLTK